MGRSDLIRADVGPDFGAVGGAGELRVIVGALLTGVFADPAINALGEGHSIVTQFVGILATIIWTAVASFVILMIVKVLVGLRPSEQEEEEGLDITQHGESVTE